MDTAGQYRLVHKVTDEQGREVEGAIVFTILGVDGEKGDVRYNGLELITDKRTYTPGDTVKLLMNTKREDSFVMLFVRGTKDRKRGPRNRHRKSHRARMQVGCCLVHTCFGFSLRMEYIYKS